MYTKCPVERTSHQPMRLIPNSYNQAHRIHVAINMIFLRFRCLERESDCGPDVATEVGRSTVVRSGSVCHNRRGSLRRHESVGADGQEIQTGKPVKMLLHVTEMGHVQ